jgi:hypothetical protein
MNKLLIAGLLLVGMVGVSEAGKRRSYGDYGTGSNSDSTYVDPYTRKDGSYVPGHYRTTPNDTTYDNYNTKGNYNPYKGTWGTQSADDN